MKKNNPLVSALGFPLLVIFAGALGWLSPGLYLPLTPYIVPLLGVIMFGMGLTVRPESLLVVLSHPKALAIGVCAQFIIMPLAGWAVATMLGLAPALAIGVIMVGACPGGTASNVIAYLAKANVALSIGMTTVSTLLAPLLTPVWVLALGGTRISVSFGQMFWLITKVVLIPVIGGSIMRLLLPSLVRRLEPFLAPASALTIAIVLGTVVARSANSLWQVGPLVLLAVIIHNLIGMTLGELIGRAAGLNRKDRSALTVEVGMQNSGLAAGLAKTFVPSPEAAVAGAIFSVWHNISGSLYAAFMRSRNTSQS
ncbi:bile acid:sodium symporter family protein [Actinomycetaceae bacterium TAE3-ERU4]|nr:bile acid:sodium symporter family protein [Actinomycetaceae bacterium TAE3-ERU4]